MQAGQHANNATKAICCVCIIVHAGRRAPVWGQRQGVKCTDQQQSCRRMAYLEKGCCHRGQRLCWPLMEPVNGAAVDQGREHAQPLPAGNMACECLCHNSNAIRMLSYIRAFTYIPYSHTPMSPYVQTPSDASTARMRYQTRYGRSIEI